MPPDLFASLTAKEREVVDLHQRGMSQRSIALYLNVTRSTVRDRIASASRKLARQK